MNPFKPRKGYSWRLILVHKDGIALCDDCKIPGCLENVLKQLYLDITAEVLKSMEKKETKKK